MNYRSIQDLSTSIAKNLHKVPSGVELIVGIPRSGLLAANLMALHLNLPLTDLEGFKAKRIFQSGDRLNGSGSLFEKITRVLVLDDSVYNGTSMRRAKAELDQCAFGKTLYFAAVYVSPVKTGEVDFYCDFCSAPRVFEWNMMHHEGAISSAYVEMDGALCKPPTPEEMDDSEKYENFLCNAAPLQPFSCRIGTIITNRLETYRPQTEDWLTRNRISYNQLTMRKEGTRDPGKGHQMMVQTKANAYAQNDKSWLFIEHTFCDARDIANFSGKMVYCMETKEMIYPDSLGGYLRTGRRKGYSFFRRHLPPSAHHIIQSVLYGTPR